VGTSLVWCFCAFGCLLLHSFLFVLLSQFLLCICIVWSKSLINKKNALCYLPLSPDTTLITLYWLICVVPVSKFNELSWMNFLSRCCCFIWQGSVAKKPYNPILGETFRCFWVLPEYETSRTEVSQNSSLQCMRILDARLHISVLIRHFRFSNCGALKRGNICRGSTKTAISFSGTVSKRKA